MELFDTMLSPVTDCKTKIQNFGNQQKVFTDIALNAFTKAKGQIAYHDWEPEWNADRPSFIEKLKNAVLKSASSLRTARNSKLISRDGTVSTGNSVTVTERNSSVSFRVMCLRIC